MKINNKNIILGLFAIFFASLLIFNGNVEVNAAETDKTSVFYENAEKLDNQLQSTDCITNYLDQSNTLTSSITSNTTGEKKIIDNIVLFVKFKGQADVYAERGGYQYIMDQVQGINDYIKEVSEDQVEVNNIFYQSDSNNIINCYEDIQPKEYFMKYSDTNPMGYTGTGPFRGLERRNELMNRVLDYVGSDFIKYLKDDNREYRVTLIVPECEDWMDLLWSCQSATQVLGKTVNYSFVTVAGKYDQTRTFCHEFLHTLGFPDMYRYDYSGTTLGDWSIMEYGYGYPTVYERLKYGGWIQNSDAIKEITKDGQYVLSPASSGQQNTIAYKIPIPGTDNQYFMIEYRGSSIGNYEKNIPEGLIAYRVNTEAKGNSDGPPDEVYVLANEGQSIFDAYLDGTVARNSFSNFKLYNSVQDLGINISNVKKFDGKMYFNISMTSNDKVTAPTNLSISQTDDNNIDLKWTHSNNLTEGYQIYRDGKFIGTTKSNSYTDSFSIEAGKTYSYQIKSFSSELGQSSDSLSGSIVARDMVTIDSVLFDKDYLTLGDSVNIKINAHGGVGQLQYKVYYWMPWGDLIVQDYSTNSNINWRPTAATAWTMRISVKDEAGNTKEVKKDFHVYDPLQVNTFTADKESPQKLGTRIKLSANIASTGSSVEMGKDNLYKFYYKLNGNTVVIQESGEESQTYFTPEKPGNYTLGVEVTDLKTKEVVTKEIEYKFIGDAQTTIYYSGYSNPYIHYKVGSGSWTSAPGVKMEASNEVSGYPYKITINLADAENIIACFNNGSGSWDSNGGKNYSFASGYYTYSNGKITEITKPSNELQINSVESTLGNTFTAGKATTLSINTSGGKEPNYYTLSVNGKEILSNSLSSSVSWTPTEAGTYAVIAKVTDQAGKTVEKTINYVITEKPVSKVTTIYYNGYENPYMHYRVGTGAWTSAPGVKMTATSEIAGYTHKITIDLGDAENLTACFNNGSGTWDSNNGKNYTFNAGTYGYSNGQIVPVENKATITNFFCYNDAYNCVGGMVEFRASASSDVGGFLYTVTATKDGQTETIVNSSAADNIIWSPKEAGKYVLTVKAVDAAGNIATKSMDFTVPGETQNQITVYYNGYATPYMHYRIGAGAWTSAPGVKMTATSEKAGYTHKITIDLGDAENLTACFNNGLGTWDSNNGSNYYFSSVGTYTYSNGKLVKIQ